MKEDENGDVVMSRDASAGGSAQTMHFRHSMGCLICPLPASTMFSAPASAVAVGTASGSGSASSNSAPSLSVMETKSPQEQPDSPSFQELTSTDSTGGVSISVGSAAGSASAAAFPSLLSSRSQNSGHGAGGSVALVSVMTSAVATGSGGSGSALYVESKKPPQALSLISGAAVPPRAPALRAAPPALQPQQGILASLSPIVRNPSMSHTGLFQDGLTACRVVVSWPQLLLGCAVSCRRRSPQRQRRSSAWLLLYDLVGLSNACY